MSLICKEDLINNIGKMIDIDGYREGDTVSRRAVITIIDSMGDKKEKTRKTMVKRIIKRDVNSINAIKRIITIGGTFIAGIYFGLLIAAGCELIGEENE